MNTLPISRWIRPTFDLQRAEVLQRELNIPSVVAQILVSRGYDTVEEADRFLHPKLEHLHDPHLLPDYQEAENRILSARERGQLIYVHGDYDVDGVTSAAIFSRFLRKVGCKVHTHVPHRMKEGYGIHDDAVDDAISVGASLFLTCDCGISAHSRIDKARESGMDVVVTDHHSVGASLPNAHAVVNPHRLDSVYPFDELAGAGVVFKVCEGLTLALGHDRRRFQEAFLDLAALGTISDVMPLVGENRVIAKFGLERLAVTKKPGLVALMREAKIDVQGLKQLASTHVSFRLGPRLNAAGRIDDAAIALRLLLATEDAEAADLAHVIEEVNTARRAEQQKITDEAITYVREHALDKQNVIFVTNPGWHPGVVGIVASRLVETFRRPSFVGVTDPISGKGKASARSIPGFHLADAIRSMPEVLDGGGHAMAAGCSFDANNLSTILQGLHDYAGARLSPEDFLPVRMVDGVVGLEEINHTVATSLSLLEPFGTGNPEPTFMASEVGLVLVKPTRNPVHAQFRVGKDGQFSSGIYFNFAENLAKIELGSKLDLLFTIQVDEYNGGRAAKMELKDFRPSTPLVN